MAVQRDTSRAIVCDIGGVLTAPPVHAAAEYLAGHGLALDEVAAAIAAYARERGRDPLVELELGRIDEAEFLAMVADALSLDPSRARFLAGFSDHYFSTVELNHALLTHLGALRARGVRMAILSNNARDWHARWTAMPELAIFEVFVNSALEGVRKPDPAIYRIAVERLGVDASLCVFLDDLEANCRVARGAGMQAIHFTGTPAAVEAIDRCLELLAERA